MKVIAVIAVAVLLLGGGGGYYWANQRGELRLANLEREHQRQLIEADARYRLLEQQHARQVRELAEDYAQKEREQREVDARVISELRNGIERLRFEISNRDLPVVTATDAASQGVDGTDESGPARETNEVVEIAPHVAEELWAIAAKGDEAIRKLNALQDWVTNTLGVYADVATN